jgi:predicted Zn-dependent protease with MMP-like domain
MLGETARPDYLVGMDKYRDIELGPAAFLSLAEAAFAGIPQSLRQYVGEVIFHIDDFAEPEILADMEIDSPYDLLGLYQGLSLDQKSAGAAPADVDHIFLYRAPILDYCDASGETLSDVVRHVLIHEIGHHFGLSDADMERIEATP